MKFAQFVAVGILREPLAAPDVAANLQGIGIDLGSLDFRI
jgi:hypothetical protein